MPNAGQFVTDAEVLAFVTNMATIQLTETLIIRGVEQVLLQEFASATGGKVLRQTEYVDEEITISDPELWFGPMLVRRRPSFLLKHRPVVGPVSVRIVLTRSDYDGSPQDVLEVTRDRYHVNRLSGIISLFRPLDISAYMTGAILSSDSWPEGPGVILVSYSAGYSLADIPEDALSIFKLLVLQVVARFYQLFKQNLWHESTVTGEFGQVNIRREDLTPEERFCLRSFAGMLG